MVSIFACCERLLLWVERYPFRFLFPNLPLQQSAQSWMSGVAIVCGDCAGEESAPAFTEMTAHRRCAQCGGRSFVNAGWYSTQVAIARAVDNAFEGFDGRFVSRDELDALDRVVNAAREILYSSSAGSRRRLAWALEELDRVEQPAMRVKQEGREKDEAGEPGYPGRTLPLRTSIHHSFPQ